MDVVEIVAQKVREAVNVMSTQLPALIKGKLDEIEEDIDTKVSGLYKPGGSATLATLPPLSAASAGYVYNMSEDFTTNSDFREGAGHDYPAGTNVVVADIGGGAYKYDALSGFLDGYVVKVPGKGLSTNDYTTAEKNKLSGMEAEANKTTIDATLSNTGQAADAKAAGDAIAALRAYLLRMESYCEASGNPATFQDAKATNIKALSVTIAPTQSGSGDPSPSNIRPISGISSVSVTRTGRNLLYLSNMSSVTSAGITWTPNGDGTVTANGTSTAQSRIYFTTEPYGAETTVYMRTTDNNIKGYSSALGNIWNNGAKTIPAGQSPGSIFLYVDEGVTVNNAVCSLIRVLSGADSSVERGVRDSVTIPLVDSNSNPLTVYGGTLDVTAGTLFVTWANIASYNGEALPGRWISDRDVYASGTTPTTGAQVVYELAAPLTYQLTPQQLATLSGYNVVSSDAGAVDVTYKADTSLVFGGGT